MIEKGDSFLSDEKLSSFRFTGDLNGWEGD